MSRMLNIELAERVLQHIEAHPELHDQHHWAKRTSCGTTACLAGWTVLLGAPPQAEVQWTDDTDDDEVAYWGNEVAYWGNEVAIAPDVPEEDDEVRRFEGVEFYAAELLGIKYARLHPIFHTMDNRQAIDHFRFLIEEVKRDAASTA